MRSHLHPEYSIYTCILNVRYKIFYYFFSFQFVFFLSIRFGKLAIFKVRINNKSINLRYCKSWWNYNFLFTFIPFVTKSCLIIFSPQRGNCTRTSPKHSSNASSEISVTHCHSSKDCPFGNR